MRAGVAALVAAMVLAAGCVTPDAKDKPASAAATQAPQGGPGHQHGGGCGHDLSGPYPVPRGFTKEAVAVECSDGYRLNGDFLKRTRSRRPENYPAVIYLHEEGKERHMWHAQALFTAQRRMVALSLDLRGYGENPGSVGNPETTATGFTEAEYRLMLEDMRNAVSFLAIKDEVNGGRIGLVGSGMGANLALLVAGSPWAEAVRIVIAISPSLEWKGMNMEAAAARIPKSTKVYLAAAKDDPGSHAACVKLMGAINGPKELYEPDTGGSGVMVFQGRDFHKIPTWLMETLVEPLPAQPARNDLPVKELPMPPRRTR